MKKIRYILLSLLPLFALLACEDKDTLVFEHEKPQFEIRNDAILVEVIVPRETTTTEDIYIVGDFNGGVEAVGKLEWKLEKSSNDLKWGIYLYPENFVNGKSLADGYYFTSLTQGNEVTLDNEEVIHRENGNVGSRVDVKIVRWAAYFQESGEWPVIPANMIMLKLTVPDFTPDRATIAIYGEVNDWNGEDNKWKATYLDRNRYYFLLDPSDFAEGKTLADEFKVAVIRSDKDWWYHQANLDGSDNDGPGLTVAGATVGRGYDIEIVNWRNSAELGEIVPSDGVILKWKQVGGNWSSMYVYCWGGDPNEEPFGGWPGTLVTPDAEGWYSITVPESNVPQNLILNNNDGSQLNFVIDPVENACYEVNTSSNTFTAIDCEDGTGGDIVITVKWREINDTWADMYMYAWSGAGSTDEEKPLGSWPGTKAELDADGWYSMQIPINDAVNTIINNGDGNGKQMNFLSNPQANGCYWVDYTDNDTNSFQEVDCVGGANTNGITIRWINVGATWPTFGIYAYGGSPVGDTFGSWPGEVVTPDAQGWYSVTVPAGQSVGNVILNIGEDEGGDGRQFDISEKITSDICIQVLTDSTYTIVNCN